MIASATILLLILLPITLSLLLSLSPIQNFVGKWATTYVSQYLNTEVRVGHINITMRGGIELSQLLVRDLQADTLIYLDRIETQIDRYLPISKNLRLGNSTIEGAVVNLRARENEDGSVEMNMKQIVKLISPRNSGESQFSMNIANVVVEGARLTIEQLTHQNPIYGVDVRNMELNNLNGSITELSVEGPVVHGFIERLATIEKSGFEINNIAGELYLTDGTITIQDAKLESRWSVLDFDRIMLVGDSWSDYKYFTSLIHLDISITDGELASDDVAYFVPTLRNWGLQLSNIEFDLEGKIEDMTLSVNNVNYGEASHLVASINIEGLPDVDDATVALQVNELITNATDIDQFKWSISQSGLSESMMTKIDALGDISLHGWLDGDSRNFNFNAEVISDVGDILSEVSLNLESGLWLDAKVKLDSVEVGKVIGREELETVSMGLDVVGNIAGRGSELKVDSTIDNLRWEGDSYENITLSGEIVNEGVKGLNIRSRDPQINFDLTASGEHIFSLDTLQTPKYHLNVDINELNLTHFRVNRRDTIAFISTSIEGRAEGRDIERCWANLQVDNTLYRYNSDSLQISQIDLSMHSEEGLREAKLSSEFATLEFESPDKVAHIIKFAKNAVAEYLPALYNNVTEESLPSISAEEMESKEATSHLKITTRNLNPIANVFSRGLQIGDDSTLEFTFNPQTYLFDGALRAPYFEQGSTLAIGLDIESSNRGDSLTLHSRIGELFVGTSFIENANLIASARENRIELNSSFINPADSAIANIGLRVDLSNDEIRGREIDLRLRPSTIVRRNEEWNISSRSIIVNKQGVDVEHFKVESRDQLMTLNGRASTSIADTVRMNMRNFDLSIFSTFISQIGYNIEGRTNGEASISALFGAGRFNAEVELDSVSVNTLNAPPMRLQAEWNAKLNRARLILSDRVNGETLIRGYYVPTEVRYYAELKVDSVQMAILDPPLGGVITDTEGYADLSLILQGTRRDAHLNGTITTHNLATTVAYTKSRYTMPNGIIRVYDNLLSTTPTQIVDEKGGKASVQLDVDLKHLSNIWYKIRVVPNNLLVLNTEKKDNDTFYGQIFASGVAEIEGDKSGVKMDITATSNDNSYFFMPLMNKSNISTADFITFVQPVKRDTTSLTQRRRLLMERSNRTRGNNGAMSINLALDIRPNTEVQLVIDPTVGDIIKARGEGRMNMRIEPKSNIFDMYGDYTINEGNYLFTLRNIVNKRFVIDPGSTIQWSGSPINPILDINAIYELKTSLEPLISDESTRAIPVNCIINLSDRLTQPEVSFAIELPTADPEQQQAVANLLNDQEAVSRQFFYLMLANSFIADSATGGTGDLGVSTTAATGFELLTNQLSNWLSSSNYNVVIRYRPESELAGDEVDFGFSKGWVDNRLLVELEGNYIIDNKQAISEDASNFLGEAYITWLIDRAGALKLRGFTQTIDTYDENQGLQETGIGIYYRENFDNFHDLQQKVKARFRASEERLEQREERRAQKALRRKESEEEQELGLSLNE
ncbi:MAG: translocation/assembly module TamB domain-containing protein [Rikenellaceae bacterium]